MAIDSVVIRFLPYDINDLQMNVGVARIGFSGASPSAVYPGYAAHTYVPSPWYAFAYLNGSAAGLAGAVREWPFILLASDGVTVLPTDRNTASILLGYEQTYAGGVFEIGAYIDGTYVLLGSLVHPTFNPGLGHFSYGGTYEIDLDWPLPPAFWTSLHNAYEV